MQEAWVPLATITLNSEAASVTFGSIPSGYRDLQMVVQNRTTGSGTTHCNINSDFGTNYEFVYLYGYSGGAISGLGTNVNYFDIHGNSLTGGMSVTQFMDYSATDKHKLMLIRGQCATGDDVVAYATRYYSTNAISTLTVTPAAGNLTAGSTFSLYGSNRL